jgi:hypothetical protein
MAIDYEFDGKKIFETNGAQPIEYVLEPLNPTPQNQQSLDQAQLNKIRQDLADLKATLFTIQEQCFQANRMLAKMDEKIR